MTRASGPTPRPPQLKLVEGDPGHEGKARLARRYKLPPAKLAEPRWRDVFPAPRAADIADAKLRKSMAAEAERCRVVAAREWARVVPMLSAHGLLAGVDLAVVEDHCASVAELDRCRRDIARRGVWTVGERGAVKNPSTTAANQLRSAIARSVAELGLGPGARARLKIDAPDENPDDDVYDDDNPYDV